MFRASSAHLQEDIVVYKQHMVPSLSIRVMVDCWYAAIGRTPYSCISTGHQDSYREWRYHMLLVYNYVLLKMSPWCLKHVEESNILRINNSQCIKFGNYCTVNSWCTVRKTLSWIYSCMSLQKDIYVAVKGVGTPPKKSFVDKSKIHFWDLCVGRILFNVIMLATVNTGLYGISNLRWEFSMLQHSKRIRWLQGIVKRWGMKVCTVFMWLMIRYRSGFCKRGKEASSSTRGR